MTAELVRLERGPRPCRVLVHEGGAALLSPLAPPPGRGSPLPPFILTDTRTAELLPGGARPSFSIPQGEGSKNWRLLGEILEAMALAGLGRDSTVLGFGGGVVCDLAALAASLYMRGARLVLVPTSLVAMADAAIGGKAAIDHAGIRNLAGSFYPADEVRIHLPLLGSLPEREYRAGLAELLRTGMVAAPKILDLAARRRGELLGREPSLLDELVRRALLAKAQLCERDPFDRAERLRLNLGHTFAHALEALDPSWLHGEAVAWGMGRALDLAVQLRLCEPDWAAELEALLSAYEFRLLAAPPRSGAEPGEEGPPAAATPAGPAPSEAARRFAKALISRMRSDKKGLGGKLRLVIPRGECSATLEEVEDSRVEACLLRGMTGP